MPGSSLSFDLDARSCDRGFWGAVGGVEARTATLAALSQHQPPSTSDGERLFSRLLDARWAKSGKKDSWDQPDPKPKAKQKAKGQPSAPKVRVPGARAPKIAAPQFLILWPRPLLKRNIGLLEMRVLRNFLLGQCLYHALSPADVAVTRACGGTVGQVFKWWRLAGFSGEATISSSLFEARSEASACTVERGARLGEVC